MILCLTDPPSTDLTVTRLIDGISSNAVALAFGAPSLARLVPALGTTAGSTQVTLVGSNLGSLAAQAVYFNGVKLTPSSGNQNSLVFATPRSALLRLCRCKTLNVRFFA